MLRCLRKDIMRLIVYRHHYILSPSKSVYSFLFANLLNQIRTYYTLPLSSAHDARFRETSPLLGPLFQAL